LDKVDLNVPKLKYIYDLSTELNEIHF